VKWEEGGMRAELQLMRQQQKRCNERMIGTSKAENVKKVFAHLHLIHGAGARTVV